MQLSTHFLSGLCIALGFLLFYKLNFKKSIAIGLIFFTVGLGIGMHEHLAEDAPYYGIDMYMERVVYVREYESMPWRQALCQIIVNDDDDTSCNEKYGRIK